MRGIKSDMGLDMPIIWVPIMVTVVFANGDSST